MAATEATPATPPAEPSAAADAEASGLCDVGLYGLAVMGQVCAPRGNQPPWTPKLQRGRFVAHENQSLFADDLNHRHAFS